MSHKLLIKEAWQKTFSFYLIYSFNFARKSGSSMLCPKQQSVALALLPCPRLAASYWSTLHKPVCRHDHEAIFSTLSTKILNLCKMIGSMH